jgi:hypothetical protein
LPRAIKALSDKVEATTKGVGKMKKFVLARSYLATKTVGALTHKEGLSLSTLELPWRKNKQNKSCIPEDVYIVKRDKTGRHQWYAVQDVKGRTFIELHPAWTVKDLLGCIGLGITLNSNFDPVYPEEAMLELLEYVGDEDFLLTIRAANKDDFWV